MHWVTSLINLAQFTKEAGLNPEDYVVCGSLALRLRGYANVEPQDLDIKFSPRIEEVLVDCKLLTLDEETGKLVNKQYGIDAGRKCHHVLWDFSDFFGWSTKLDFFDPKSPYVLTEDGLLTFYRLILDNDDTLPKDKIVKFTHRVKMIEDLKTLRRLAKEWTVDGLPSCWKE